MADALDMIAQEAQQLEQSTPPAPGEAPAQEPAQKIPPAQLWAMVPRTLGSVLAIAFPKLSDVYTEERCNAWGEAMVPVAEKHGWNMSEDAPEFALLLASVPLVIGTAGVIQAQRAQVKQLARPKAEAQPADTASEQGADVPPASV